MTRTVVQEGHDHMTFEWADEGVRIIINLLQEDRSHNISGEVKVLLSGEQIHRGRLNLTSIQTRKQWQNILQERHSHMGGIDEIDWYAILEEMCSEASDIYRRGEPVHVLGEVPEDDVVRWRLSPLLLDAPTLIYGPGSSGKSMLSAYFAVLIQNGLDMNGFQADQGEVLYLDYETDAHEIATRVRMIQRSIDIDVPSKIRYRFCSSPLVTEIESIRHYVQEHSINYVIVDSVGTACGGEPESASNVLNYFAALRSLKVGTLSISHTNREGSMFGSAYLTWQARSVYEIKKSQKNEDTFIDCALHHRKSNNGKLIAPVGFRVEFDIPRGSIEIHQRGLADVEQLEGSAPLRERLEVLLRDGDSWSRDEICEALNITYSQRSNLRSVISRNKNIFHTTEDDRIMLGTAVEPTIYTNGTILQTTSDLPVRRL